MPYLIKIGYQANNKYQTTSKGYFICRRGKKVITCWGSIDVKGLRRKKFFWKGTNSPQSKEFRFSSISGANKFKQQRLTQKLNRGYIKLPYKTRIYSYFKQDKGVD